MIIALCIIILCGLLLYIIIKKTLLHMQNTARQKEHRFADDAAHELRTPLAAIKTQAQIALNSKHIEEKDHAIQKLLISVNRSTRIIQQLLILSRLSSPHDFLPVDLGMVLRDISQMLMPLALEKKITLTLQIENKLPCFLGNETAIGILIRNLLDNALRYSPEKTTLHAQAYSRRKNIILEICDQGPGIPKALHHRVFERFFRILGHQAQGSGLGLAIVRDICTYHHARIILKPAQKKSSKTLPGLCVKIYFPAKKTASHQSL